MRHAQILYFTYIYEFYLILFSRSYSIQRIEKKMCSKKRNTRTNFLKQTLKNSSSGFHFFFKTLVFYQKTGFWFNFGGTSLQFYTGYYKKLSKIREKSRIHFHFMHLLSLSIISVSCGGVQTCRLGAGALQHNLFLFLFFYVILCVCESLLCWGFGGPGGTSWLGSTGGSGVRQSNCSRLIRWTFLKFSTSCCKNEKIEN